MTIEQAVAAEREECAQLAEKSYVVSGSPGPLFDAGSRFTADLAAKSIRARGICVADIAGAVRGYFNALDAHHAKRCSYADGPHVTGRGGVKPLTDYTEVELRAMPAGAEMDALVDDVVRPRRYDQWNFNVPPYSTDPGEAFKALIATGFEYDIINDGVPWVRCGGFTVEANDIARDICIVLLLAKLSEAAARKPKGRG